MFRLTNSTISWSFCNYLSNTLLTQALLTPYKPRRPKLIPVIHTLQMLTYDSYTPAGLTSYFVLNLARSFWFYTSSFFHHPKLSYLRIVREKIFKKMFSLWSLCSWARLARSTLKTKSFPKPFRPIYLSGIISFFTILLVLTFFWGYLSYIFNNLTMFFFCFQVSLKARRIS